MVPDPPKDYACTKFGQKLLKDVDSRVQGLKNLGPPH